MVYELSLVITTYNRFDTFLNESLKKYLENPYINEIIISDDCSDDYDKLIANFSDNSKIIIVQQPKNIGALRNKIKACTYAKNDWICLMDSDNFCDINYFEALNKYWSTHSSSIDTIYSPMKAEPNFDYTRFIDVTFNKSNWEEMSKGDECFKNGGNYVFHKSAIEYLLPILSDTIDTYAIDVKYWTYILFKNNLSESKIIINKKAIE